MEHGRKYRKLNLYSGKRQGFLKNMAVSLILNESVKTTDARAKEVRRYTEKIITICKDESLASKKKAYSTLRNSKAVEKLFTALRNRYLERNGGYTRIFKIGYRAGDGASMCLVTLV